MCKYRRIIGKSGDTFYCELKHDTDWLKILRICEGCEHNEYLCEIAPVA